MIMSNLRVKIKTTIICLSAILTTILIGLVCTDYSENNIVNAENWEAYTEETLKDYYSVGDELVLPSATLHNGDESYVATQAFLQYPDGEIYNKGKYTLNQLGKYNAIYSKKHNNRFITSQISFTVCNPIYGLKKASCEYREQLNMTTQAVSGLGVSLEAGGSFVFNKPINISSYDANDVLLRVYPYNRTALNGGSGKKIEAKRVVIRMTDCYDETNYVEIYLHWGVSNAATGETHVYYRAGAKGQTYYGLSTRKASTLQSVYLDGETYKLDSRDEHGAASLSWQPNQINADNYGYNIYFDYVSKKIYVEDIGGKVFVNDLDSEEVYGSKAFKGFKTGEVYFSVYGEQFQTSTMNFEIDKIGDIENEFFNDFGLIKDITAPTIEIIGARNGQVINVAQNCRFKLFNAASYDIHPLNIVEARVYRNYGIKEQSTVTILDDNTFIARDAGSYVIEYSATDAFGNKSKQLVYLNCVSSTTDKGVILNTEKISSVAAGEICVLPEYTVSGLNGGTFVEIYAYYHNDVDNKIPIDNIKREFFPSEIGEYTITYKYGDDFVEYEYSYTLKSNSSSNVTLDLPTLPNYFIKGMSYTLDGNFARIYSGTSAKDVPAQVYIKQDNAEWCLLEDYENVQITANKTVRFRYKHNDTQIDSNIYPVVAVTDDSGLLDVKNYFAGDFKRESLPQYIAYTSNVKTGDNKLEFINVIGLRDFAFNFNIQDEYDKFNAIDIILTDNYNRNNKVVITYEKVTNGGSYRVNGGSAYSTQKRFSGVDEGVKYDATKKAFVTVSGIAIKWDNNFTGNKVILEIVLKNIDGNAGICISKINNQTFSGNVLKDRAKASIYYKPVYGDYRIGGIISVSTAEITDVLTPFLKNRFTFYVTDPNNNYVTSLSGVLLDKFCNKDCGYQFQLEMIGTYYVTYKYVDLNGNETIHNIPITINDDNPPQINIVGKNESSVDKVKVNSKIKVAEFTVVDNLSSGKDLTFKVMVFSPKYEIIIPDETDSFVADTRGLYKVCYYCYDSVGNSTLRYYFIEVI